MPGAGSASLGLAAAAMGDVAGDSTRSLALLAATAGAASGEGGGISRRCPGAPARDARVVSAVRVTQRRLLPPVDAHVVGAATGVSAIGAAAGVSAWDAAAPPEAAPGLACGCAASAGASGVAAAGWRLQLRAGFVRLRPLAAVAVRAVLAGAPAAGVSRAAVQDRRTRRGRAASAGVASTATGGDSAADFKIASPTIARQPIRIHADFQGHKDATSQSLQQRKAAQHAILGIYPKLVAISWLGP